MKRFGRIVLMLAISVLVVGVGVSSASDITYNVDLTLSNWSVIGTITTDGNLGTLGSGDLVSYALTFYNQFNNPYGFDPNGPNNDSVSGSDLTADSNGDLLFNFDGSGALYLSDSNNDFPRLVLCGPGYEGYCGGIGIGDGAYNFNAESGNQVIGTSAAAVPEPSELMLLGMGLGLLGLGQTFRSRISKKEF